LYSFGASTGEGATGNALLRYLIDNHNDIVLQVRRMRRQKNANDNYEDNDADEADMRHQRELEKYGLVKLHSILPIHVFDCSLVSLISLP
jgi:hypothetical protein